MIREAQLKCPLNPLVCGFSDAIVAFRSRARSQSPRKSELLRFVRARAVTPTRFYGGKIAGAELTRGASPRVVNCVNHGCNR